MEMTGAGERARALREGGARDGDKSELHQEQSQLYTNLGEVVVAEKEMDGKTNRFRLS